MSDRRTSVSTSWTDEELDVLDTLAFLESVGGRRRAAMVRRIVEERLAYVMAHDPIVRELVAGRRDARGEDRGQQRLRLLNGGKP